MNTPSPVLPEGFWKRLWRHDSWLTIPKCVTDVQKETRGGCAWVLRFGFSASNFWNPKRNPSLNRETPRDLWLLTAPWWKVMSRLINAWKFFSHVLIFDADLPVSKAQAMLAAHCMDLRDSTAEPLTATVFISCFCFLWYSLALFLHFYLFPDFPSVLEGSCYCMIPRRCTSQSGKCAM